MIAVKPSPRLCRTRTMGAAVTTLGLAASLAACDADGSPSVGGGRRAVTVTAPRPKTRPAQQRTCRAARSIHAIRRVSHPRR